MTTFDSTKASLNDLLREIREGKFRIVQTEGSRQISRLLDHYNLDAILAVGYRTRSPVGTAFRQWATARLREYLVKGFTLNNERAVFEEQTACYLTPNSHLPAANSH